MSNHVVCELHFNAEDIERCYETKLPDGVIHTIERANPKLKRGAIPCLFPNLLSYLSKEKRKRKAPAIHQVPIPSTSALDESSPVKILNSEWNLTITEPESVRNDFEWMDLMKVSLPSTKWTTSLLKYKDCIIFAEWTEHFTVKKASCLKSRYGSTGNYFLMVFFGAI